MIFQVKVFVTPKRGILDPQGRAVEQSLKSLGFGQVDGVRVGKYIALNVEAAAPAEARQMVARMCEQLLANTVIEDYRFEVEPLVEPESPQVAPPRTRRRMSFRDE